MPNGDALSLATTQLQTQKFELEAAKLEMQLLLQQVGWVTCDPRVAIVKSAITAWVQEPTLPIKF